MATVDSIPVTPAFFPCDWSMADLQSHLGDIPAERIRLVPAPGSATEQDVTEIAEREGRLFELEYGTLVEKPMGWYESLLAGYVLTQINNFLEIHDLGKAFGADGTVRIRPNLVKIPDVCFIGWERWPATPLPRRPIPALVPHLAIEVLSETNTTAEMSRKLEQYFASGVLLVWYIDPETRSARVFTSPTDVTEIDEHGVLDGGEVLPGFHLSLAKLFQRADRQRPE